MGDVSDEPVARLMTVGVIYPLKIIYVDHKQRMGMEPAFCIQKVFGILKTEDCHEKIIIRHSLHSTVLSMKKNNYTPWWSGGPDGV